MEKRKAGEDRELTFKKCGETGGGISGGLTERTRGKDLNGAPRNSRRSFRLTTSEPKAASLPKSSSSSSSSKPTAAASEEKKTSAGAKKEAPKTEAKSGGEYTAADVAKHNKKDDIWVIINGEVLDVTKVYFILFCMRT